MDTLNNLNEQELLSISGGGDGRYAKLYYDAFVAGFEAGRDLAAGLLDLLF